MLKSMNRNLKATIILCLFIVTMLMLFTVYVISYFKSELKESISVQEFALASSLADAIDDSIVLNLICPPVVNRKK